MTSKKKTIRRYNCWILLQLIVIAVVVAKITSPMIERKAKELYDTRDGFAWVRGIGHSDDKTCELLVKYQVSELVDAGFDCVVVFDSECKRTIRVQDQFSDAVKPNIFEGRGYALGRTEGFDSKVEFGEIIATILAKNASIRDDILSKSTRK